MRKINQQDQTDQEEEDGTDESNIVAPEGEEGVWNQEGDDNKTNPGNQLGTPEAILNGRSLVSGVADSDEEERENEMEETQGEVDAVYGGESIALFASACDGGIVEQDVLKLLYSPVGEHNP